MPNGETHPENPGATPSAPPGSPNPGEVAAALDEELADTLAEQEENPWELIAQMRDLQPNQRQRHLDRFLALAALRPAAEQDSLLAYGQPVWRYRTDTVRRTIESLREEGGAPKTATTVVGPDFLAESVLTDDAQRPVKFLVRRFDSEEWETETLDQFPHDGILYMPTQSKLVSIGCVLLASDAVEYESEMRLYNEIKEFVAYYLHVNTQKFLDTIVDYILMTWIYDKFDVVPYLRALGDTGCGKTRLLEVVGSVVYRGMFAMGAASSSSLFRTIDKFNGTLIMDEADFKQSDMYAEVMKILLCGYQKSFPIWRAKGEGSDYDPDVFKVYGPKVLATRKMFTDDALENRCLSYTMPLIDVLPSHIPLVLGPEFRQEARGLRNKLLRWRFNRFPHARLDPHFRVEGLSSRMNQIVLPLLASVSDANMHAAILEHAQAHQRSLHQQKSQELLGYVARAIAQRRQRTQGNKILLKEVAESVSAEMEEKVTSQMVAELSRTSLGLETTMMRGVTWIKITDERARDLAVRYMLGEAERTAVRRTPVPAPDPGGDGRVARTPVPALTPAGGPESAQGGPRALAEGDGHGEAPGDGLETPSGPGEGS